MKVRTFLSLESKSLARGDHTVRHSYNLVSTGGAIGQSGRLKGKRLQDASKLTGQVLLGAQFRYERAQLSDVVSRWNSPWISATIQIVQTGICDKIDRLNLPNEINGVLGKGVYVVCPNGNADPDATAGALKPFDSLDSVRVAAAPSRVVAYAVVHKHWPIEGDYHEHIVSYECCYKGVG
jgi:hypothetical protein